MILASALLHAQQPPAQQQTPPVFRGGTIIVPLDVTVLDKQGNPVTDLTQADFTVYENKVKQDIKSFFPQALTARAPEAVGALLPHPRFSDTIAPRERRTFLIVLGFGRIQVPARGLDGAQQFLREHLLPQDVVGLIGFNRATEFTTDHEQVAQTIERYKPVHEKLVFDIDEYMRYYRGRKLPPIFQDRIDAIFTGVPDPDPDKRPRRSGPAAEVDPSIPRPRSVPQMLLNMNGTTPKRDKPGQRQPTFDDVQRDVAYSGVQVSDAVVRGDLLKVYGGIEYLRNFDGEKHLVYLGEGIRLSADAARLVAARANDARVVVDITHTMGVPTAGSQFDLIAAAEDVSRLSGGQFTGVRYAREALDSVDRASRFTYLLGYSPANPTLDGTYRDVNVVVNRKDVTVQFHHGYYAAETPAPVDMEDAIIDARIASAGEYSQPADDLKLTVKAAPAFRLGTIAQLRVDVTIDARKLAFTETPNGRTAQVDVQIFCGDQKEQRVGELRRRIELQADEATYQRFLRDGVPFTARVPVTGVVKYVKVIAYDYHSDLLGLSMLKIGK